MKWHASFISACLLLVLENLNQMTSFGILESQHDFRSPEFVSTTTLSQIRIG